MNTNMVNTSYDEVLQARQPMPRSEIQNIYNNSITNESFIDYLKVKSIQIFLPVKTEQAEHQ